MSTLAPHPHEPCDVAQYVTIEDVVRCGPIYCPPEEGVWDEFLCLAASMMYRLTGWRYPGCCDQKVRPCWQICDDCGGGAWGYGLPTPTLINGKWYNKICGCACKTMTKCELSGIPLWPGPVKGIRRIWLDGVEYLPLDPDDMGCGTRGEDQNGDRFWRLDDFRMLTRCDGEDWPDCQDLCAEDDEEGAFTIEYCAGMPPPKDVRRAAAMIARELICACTNRSKCRMPSYWDKIDRDGMSITNTGASLDMICKGLTGIDPFIDQLISTHGGLPSGRARLQQSRVLSLDIQPRRNVRYGSWQ